MLQCQSQLSCGALATLLTGVATGKWAIWHSAALIIWTKNVHKNLQTSTLANIFHRHRIINQIIGRKRARGRRRHWKCLLARNFHIWLYFRTWMEVSFTRSYSLCLSNRSAFWIINTAHCLFVRKECNKMHLSRRTIVSFIISFDWQSFLCLVSLRCNYFSSVDISLDIDFNQTVDGT